jgi:glycosyltransferase involved in cell wall biosynthesis
MEEWRKRDPRILYFRRAIPGNIAEASNFGLSHARGGYIAVCCGGGVIVVDQAGREQMRYLKPEHDEQIKRRALLANPLAHSTTLYRREAALRTGGYDETLAGFQDWDLWLKLGRLGKLYNFPEYFLHYRVWQGSGSFQQSKGNTESALTITRRYRRDYAGFAMAFPLALLYNAYAHMPASVQRVSYSALSRLKKAAFSHRPVPNV